MRISTGDQTLEHGKWQNAMAVLLLAHLGNAIDMPLADKPTTSSIFSLVETSLQTLVRLIFADKVLERVQCHHVCV